MVNCMSNLFFEKYGDWALVTGASSGIGKEFCYHLASMEFNLVLVARRIDRLNALAEELKRKHNIEILVVALDLAQENFMEKLTQATADIPINLLINCAGFAVTGEFISHPVTIDLALLHVNCTAPLLLSRHYGQKMTERKKGGIINIASASAYLPIPFWASYSASKVFLLHFSEALWYEMKKYGVDVIAVCPPSTNTEFGKVAKINMRGIPAETVVNVALKNIGKKASIAIGLGLSLSMIIMKFISRKTVVLLASKIIGNQKNKINLTDGN
jgi:uncharacterized protein